MQTLIETRDGRKLDVLISGDEKSKLALVCHHGTPSDSTLWNDWGEDASKHNLRLVSISRPGYATSDRKTGRVVCDVTEDVIDVLDKINRNLTGRGKRKKTKKKQGGKLSKGKRKKKKSKTKSKTKSKLRK